jgi:hypothetical protein
MAPKVCLIDYDLLINWLRVPADYYLSDFTHFNVQFYRMCVGKHFVFGD